MVAWLAALALGANALAFAPSAVVQAETVTLADVADVAALPPDLAARARTLPIAAFAPTAQRLTISARRAAERARAQLPALAPWLTDASAAHTIVVTRTLPVAAPALLARTCVRIAAALPAGARPAAEELSAAPCSAEPGSVFAYEPVSRIVMTTRALEKGEIVYAPPADLVARVQAGEALRLAIDIGPVRVERDVIAVRAAPAGAPVFVVAGGDVFAAPAPALEPEATP